MEQTCHRCGTGVSREDAFCPSCGAAQLNFDVEGQEPADDSLQKKDAAARPGQVIWRDAIGAAVMVAVPTGILCGLLSVGSFLWVIAGAALVILLYKKKRPGALLSARSGFRIGGLTGLAIAYISVAVNAIFSVVQRYPMHQGAVIDGFYEKSMAYSATMLTNMFQGSDMQSQIRATTHFWMTPDGRAASAYIALVSVTVMTTLFASLGGYIGVRLFTGRRAA